MVGPSFRSGRPGALQRGWPAGGIRALPAYLSDLAYGQKTGPRTSLYGAGLEFSCAEAASALERPSARLSYLIGCSKRSVEQNCAPKVAASSSVWTSNFR